MDLKRAVSSGDKKYIDILDCYNDKSFVYSVLMIQASSYFNTLKYAFQLPIIITSSVLSILNGSTGNSHIDDNMKMINTVFNILTALTLSVNNTFRFEAKANECRINALKFQKITHIIESKVLESGINGEFINSITSAYDNIVESITEDIPPHICRRVHLLYRKKKHLPVIINGVNKEENNDILIRQNSPLRKLSNILLKPVEPPANSPIEQV